MQKIGDLASHGFTLEQLTTAKDKLTQDGFQTELHELACPEVPSPTDAHILIVRNYLTLDKQQDTHQQLQALQWDTKAKMYGRVVNKHARWNLCFASFSQEPDYEQGCGRVVPWTSVPLLEQLKGSLGKYLTDRSTVATSLVAEGNYYHDAKKCGIGYHGDAERRRVIGIRFGTVPMDLHYQWYLQSKPLGPNFKFTLNPGDLYIMSEKATGFDWKTKKTPTLRHAAGASKFTSLK
jgi:hypothetical protein